MLKSLQIGRALAALAVAAMHLSIIFGDPRYGDAPVWRHATAYGGLGVPFFFVLSGYIILFAHRRDIGRPERLGRYAYKRAVRIYPLYWALTAVLLLGAGATGGVSSAGHSIGDFASVLLLVRFTTVAAPLGVAWTLYHEVFFYALFAVLIWKRSAGVAVLALWFGAVALVFTYTPHGDWSFRNTALSAINLCFLMGMAAYALTTRLGRNAGAALLGGSALLFVAIMVVNSTLIESPAFDFAYSLCFMGAIAGAVSAERGGWVPRVPLLGLIGDASYSLYLCHEAVESNMLKVFRKLGVLGALDHRVVYLIVYALTVAVALALYRFVEKPLLDRLRRRAPARAVDPAADPAHAA